MKTSAVVASLLFSACAVAAPFDKRRVVTTTQVVTETVLVYTTVYDNEGPAPTSSQGLFYEQPAQSTPVAASTSAAAPAYTPPAPAVSSQAYTPAPQAPTPTPEAPKEQPQPTSAAYVAPAPAPTSAAPAPAPVQSTPPTTNHQTTGDQYTGVDITIYNGNGDLGACGKPINDNDLVAAVSKGVWGQSTYDVMTGQATNPWCGQKIQVNYNGRSVIATVMDMCPGCLGADDVDLTMGAFQVVTGSQEITRYHGASWSKVA